MKIEKLSKANLNELTRLVLDLWPACNFSEEYAYFKGTISKEEEVCYLAKDQNEYMAFIHLTLRKEYVEGAVSSPVGYVEGIYVKPDFRETGVGRELLGLAQKWAKLKGCKEMASDAEIDNLQSIVFHRKNGFRESNRIVCFIMDLPEGEV